MALHALALVALGCGCPAQNASFETIFRHPYVALVVLREAQVAANACRLLLIKLQESSFVLVDSLLWLVNHLEIRVLSCAHWGAWLFDSPSFMFDCFESHCVIALPLNIQTLSTVKTKTGHVAVFNIVAVDLVLLVRLLMSRLPHWIIVFLLRSTIECQFSRDSISLRCIENEVSYTHIKVKPPYYCLHRSYYVLEVQYSKFWKLLNLFFGEVFLQDLLCVLFALIFIN